MNSEEISYEQIVKILEEDSFVLLKMGELWFVAATNSLILQSCSHCGPPEAYPSISICTSNPTKYSHVHPRVQTMLSFYHEYVWYQSEDNKKFFISHDHWVHEWDAKERLPIYLLLLYNTSSAIHIIKEQHIGLQNTNALSRLKKEIDTNNEQSKTSELPLVISSDYDGNIIFITK